MFVNGRELLLSPRKTADHYSLIETIKSNPDLPELLYMAQMVNDSLKATFINLTAGIDKLSFFKRYRKLKSASEYKMFFDGKIGNVGSIVYLINYLSPQELVEYSGEITKLDGLDKKKVVAENQSVEKLPEG